MTRPTSFRQSPGGNSSGTGSASSGVGGLLSNGGGGHNGDHLQLPSGAGGLMMEPGSLLHKVRVKYRSLRFKDNGAKQNESESEALISGDDDDDLIIGMKTATGPGLLPGGNVMQRSTGGNGGGGTGGGGQSIQMA